MVYREITCAQNNGFTMVYNVKRKTWILNRKGSTPQQDPNLVQFSSVDVVIEGGFVTFRDVYLKEEGDRFVAYINQQHQTTLNQFKSKTGIRWHGRDSEFVSKLDTGEKKRDTALTVEESINENGDDNSKLLREDPPKYDEPCIVIYKKTMTPSLLKSLSNFLKKWENRINLYAETAIVIYKDQPACQRETVSQIKNYYVNVYADKRKKTSYSNNNTRVPPTNTVPILPGLMSVPRARRHSHYGCNRRRKVKKTHSYFGGKPRVQIQPDIHEPFNNMLIPPVVRDIIAKDDKTKNKLNTELVFFFNACSRVTPTNQPKPPFTKRFFHMVM